VNAGKNASDHSTGRFCWGKEEKKFKTPPRRVTGGGKDLGKKMIE